MLTILAIPVQYNVEVHVVVKLVNATFASTFTDQRSLTRRKLLTAIHAWAGYLAAVAWARIDDRFMKIGCRAKQPLFTYVFSRHQFYAAWPIVLYIFDWEEVAHVYFTILVFANFGSVTKKMSLAKISFVGKTHLEMIIWNKGNQYHDTTISSLWCVPRRSPLPLPVSS